MITSRRVLPPIESKCSLTVKADSRTIEGIGAWTLCAKCASSSDLLCGDLPQLGSKMNGERGVHAAKTVFFTFAVSTSDIVRRRTSGRPTAHVCRG